MDPGRADSLVVILSDPILLRLHSGRIEEPIELGQRVFVDVGLGTWVGFYDWLRTSNGELVGVRTWLHEDGARTDRIIEAIARNSAVDRGEHDELIIWPSERCSFDVWMSCDQDLGTHRLLRAESGELAFTFEIDALTENERATVDTWVEDRSGAR